jgi:hypothetical protein
MKFYNFWANDFDFGIWEAENIDQAKENFAKDAGYFSWADMVSRADEFGGNSVEFKEIERN